MASLICKISWSSHLPRCFRGVIKRCQLEPGASEGSSLLSPAFCWGETLGLWTKRPLLSRTQFILQKMIQMKRKRFPLSG